MDAHPQRYVNPWVVTVSVMLATFMEVLDTTVVNVSIPHIAGNLGVDQRRRHVGRHVLPGLKRHRAADFGVAGEPHRAQAAAADLRRRIHRNVALLRPGDFADRS